MTFSVLIPSWRRPEALRRCLLSLAQQTLPPHEVIVIWQADDTATRDAAQSLSAPYPLKIFHSENAGVVPAENLGLRNATGEIIALIDDDAVATPAWLARHARHFEDQTVGAVGGSVDNFLPDGQRFPKRDREPIGALNWFGKLYGNMFDHVDDWVQRPPIPVRHLIGGNMTLRRSAFDEFAEGLRPYWQEFELEACLQVQARGFRVLFDFENRIEHHPTNTAWTGGRDGDLQVKIFNAAYNHAYILSKHSPFTLRLPRLLFHLLVGSVDRPGFVGMLAACRRYGDPARELRVLVRTWGSVLRGWHDGARKRK